MTTLDMSLDDMIKSRRTTEKGSGRGKARRGRGGQGRSAGTGKPTGPPCKGPLRLNARPAAHTIAKSFRRPKSLPWQYDLLEESLKAAGLPGLDSGTKLYVSNLDIGVTNEDIRELFSEIGELQRYAIHYDKSGRPNGTAEVMFARRSDAFQALKRYNNVQLDGKPMKIEIVGSKSEVPLAPRVNVVGVNGQRTVVMMPGVGHGRKAAVSNRTSGQRIRGGTKNGRGGTMNGRGSAGSGRGHGGGRGQGGGRGRGHGRGKKPAVEKSADELDKELENYHAMQT